MAINRLFWNWPREMVYVMDLTIFRSITPVDISRHILLISWYPISILPHQFVYSLAKDKNDSCFSFSSNKPYLYYLSKILYIKWKEKLILFNAYPILQPIFTGSGYEHYNIRRHICTLSIFLGSLKVSKLVYIS